MVNGKGQREGWGRGQQGAVTGPPPLPAACRAGTPVTLSLWPRAGSEDHRSRFGSECFLDLVCPERCRCEGTIVDCSNQKLARVPSHLPEYVTDL